MPISPRGVVMSFIIIFLIIYQDLTFGIPVIMYVIRKSIDNTLHYAPPFTEVWSSYPEQPITLTMLLFWDILFMFVVFIKARILRKLDLRPIVILIFLLSAISIIIGINVSCMWQDDLGEGYTIMHELGYLLVAISTIVCFVMSIAFDVFFRFHKRMTKMIPIWLLALKAIFTLFYFVVVIGFVVSDLIYSAAEGKYKQQTGFMTYIAIIEYVLIFLALPGIEITWVFDVILFNLLTDGEQSYLEIEHQQ